MINIAEAKEQVTNQLIESFKNNKKIKKLVEKIEEGTATYADAADFAEIIGLQLSQSFQILIDNVGLDINLDELADEIVTKMLMKNYDINAITCEIIQDNLNKAAGLGLAPKQPKLDTSRIAGLQLLVKEAESPDKLKELLGENIVNYSEACVDKWVSENASFQARLGMDPVVVRKWSGSRPSHDTKGTDWCKELAGTYHYKDGKFSGPAAVFARHKGCRCTVEYFPEGSTTGKITALQKGEKDTNKVLWNTGKITSYSKEAVRRRNRQQHLQEEIIKKINE